MEGLCGLVYGSGEEADQGSESNMGCGFMADGGTDSCLGFVCAEH